MTEAERIKLAEAMGWTHIRMNWVAMAEKSYPFGCPPADQYSNKVVDKRFKEQIPDPEHNANDANQLIVFLTQQGYEAHIMWPAGDRLDLKGRVQLWIKGKRVADEYFDAEMFGDAVARAALKVIDND